MSLCDERLELKEIQRLEGHTDRVWGLAWSPAAAAPPMFASCGGDKTVRIWQQSSPSGSFECKKSLCHVDGMWWWNGRNGAAAGWDSGEVVKVAGDGGGCGGGRGSMVQQSGGGGGLWWLRRGSYDNTIKVWAEDGDNDDWHCVQTLDESTNDDLTVKIWGTDLIKLQSGDGNAMWEGIIASGAADDAIRLFVDNKDGLVDGPMYELLLKKDKAHDMDVNSVQWNSSDNGLLASASDDGSVKIWKLTSLP
ncbi:transducin/WD40 repeat-like superfamily protein [Actinidia rufa]|uniref:Transducin/WD40 repeat-like superfamily protein n=1 Tax=Actinidia rufa TaxID=165716 RepID=A0A7J0FGL3_9ERIC|nr:transducin/WD40 repeat-like superfamily protein [Actinidia rufa]